MAAIEVTRQAREELRQLIGTRQLPADTRERVSGSLSLLGEYPRAGKQLSGVWRDCRALVGPWGWMIVVYVYIEADDRVVVIAFHDARTSDAAIARSNPVAGTEP
jgi:hypothetical protein